MYLPEGALESATTCDPSCRPADIACDALDQDFEGIADEGCLDNRCAERDHDEFPYRFTSGRIETQPVIAYATSAARDVFFGVRLQYGSELRRTPAVRNPPDTSPTIHAVTEDTHFVGANWYDNFSDRLIPRSLGGSGPHVWIGSTGTVNFDSTGLGPWLSDDGRHTLRLTTTGSTPRYTITSDAIDGPVRVWVFDVVDVKIGANTRPVGTLVAYGSPDDLNTLSGGYMVSIQRLSDNRIDVVRDTLGREIGFVYSPIIWANVTRAYRVDAITFRNSPTATPVIVAELAYTSLHPGDPVSTLLDRIGLPLQGTYRRFRYFSDPGCDHSCGIRVTEVIAPASGAGASAPPGAAALASEEVVEGHEWCLGEDCQPFDEFTQSGAPDVKRTWGPGRDWGYERAPGSDSENSRSIYQFDLHQPDESGADCNTGCVPGYRCWQPTGLCYRYNETVIDTEYRHVRASAGSRFPGGGGETYLYGEGAKPLATVDLAGSITSYGESPDRSLACSIVGDDDYLALDSTNSECSPPASGEYELTKQTRTPTTTTVSRTSILQPTSTSSTETTVNASGLVTSTAVSGWTATIGGDLHEQTRTTTYGYDTLGRLVSSDGPRLNSDAYDVVDYEYWPDDSDERGRLRYIRTYVGTDTGHSELRWEYSNYDVSGVARTIVAPNGARIDLVPSSPLDFHVEVSGPGAPTQTQRIQLNPNGTLRSVRYGSGTCVTYDYQTPDGYIAAPVAIKRTHVGAPDCDALPVDRTTGTVATFDYAFDEPDRLMAARVYQDGILTSSADGFVYSPDRRLLEAASPHSPLPHVLSYEDGIPVAQWSPGWPASDAWRVDASIDGFGRAFSLDRYVTPTDKVTAELFYDPRTAPLPTRVETGLNGSAQRTVHYIWDDFGRLIASTVPEHGVTRWEYDVSGNPIKVATAVGSSSQVVRYMAYDSLGRLTSSHYGVQPADCAGLPDGSPVERLDIRYDSCESAPPGFDCEHAATRVAAVTASLECRDGTATVDKRHFAYTATGVVDGVAFLTTSDEASSPVVMNHLHEGRDGALTETTLSIAESATTYSYDDIGQISAVGNGTRGVVTDIGHTPSGAITTLLTPAGLRMDRSYNTDGSTARVLWREGSTSLVDKTYAYYPNGLMKSSTDATAGDRSRYYQYDRLLRLTCEAHGDGASPPGPADCTAESPNLIALFGYASFEPSVEHDWRITALQSNGAPASGDFEAFVYEPGTMRPIRVVHDGVIVDELEYDAAGRRIGDGDPGAPASRREYTYWPSGRLRQISGTSDDGAPYAIIVSYDPAGGVREERHRVNDTVTLIREFFWKPDGTLMAVRETASGQVTVWLYHSVGAAPLAVTKEANGTQALYWFVTDARGLVVRVVDSFGVDAYSADYDAGGWPINVVNSGGIYMPFGLPGQLAIPETGRLGEDGRVPVTITGGRAYDPQHQLWLSPDPEDATYRLAHEGYSYARANPVAFADPGGNQTEYSHWLPLVPTAFQPLGPGRSIFVDKSCDGIGVDAAIATAIHTIKACSTGPCGFPGGETFKRQWLAALSWGSYYCPRKGREVYAASGQLIGGAFESGSPYDGYLWTPDARGRHTPHVAYGFTLHQTALGMADRIVMYAPKGSPCGLAAFVAHEASHSASGTMWWWEPFFGHGKAGAQLWASPWLPELHPSWSLHDRAASLFNEHPPDSDFEAYSVYGADEALARWAVKNCFGCRAGE